MKRLIYLFFLILIVSTYTIADNRQSIKIATLAPEGSTWMEVMREFENSVTYDKRSSLDIVRVKGIKLFRKYRKANLVNDFINSNKSIRAIITDHWKSLELIKTEHFKKVKTFCLLHSKEINHEVGSSLNKRLIRSTNNADYIIANSNFTKELAIKVGINKS